MKRRANQYGAVWNSLLILMLGVGLGVLSKWADGQCTWLSELTSGIAFWILLASVVALESRNPWQAARNVLLLLGSMVLAYYAAAEVLGGVWGRQFLIGWGVMALLSPVPGFFVWYARGGSVRAWILRLGVLGFQILATTVLLGRVGVMDALAIAATAVLLLRMQSVE